ncbi:MAG: NAD(P)H-dependent oxidoreductase [Selenomonas sp.]|nr:NAD(P)H-dependent oxidoreductase [Selenomonas sp.]
MVFAMPTYWFSIPSNIKGVFDRMYSFMVGGKMEQLAGKKTALMICCMSEDISVMDDVKSPFEKAFGMLKWDCIGEVLIPGVGNPGDVQKTDGLKQSASLAELI